MAYALVHLMASEDHGEEASLIRGHGTLRASQHSRSCCPLQADFVIERSSKPSSRSCRHPEVICNRFVTVVCILVVCGVGAEP
jgi:hypothetical protein